MIESGSPTTICVQILSFLVTHLFSVFKIWSFQKFAVPSHEQTPGSGEPSEGRNIITEHSFKNKY
jgi:hypothetical protein